jgi:dipeptidase E
MKILLTSSGIRNASIHDALVELLGKPIAECSALCIPTGVQPFPGGPSHVHGFINGSVGDPICGLGWKSFPGWPTSCRHCGPTWCMSAPAAVRWSRLPTSGERPMTTVIHSQAATKRWGLLVSVFPHLYREGDIPATPLAEIEAWAAGLSVPAYAIDDQTAIKVVDGALEVLSGDTGSCSPPPR